MVTDGLITVQGLTVIKAVAKDARARPAPLENSKRIVTVPALEGYGETTELHHPHLFSERFAHSHHYCRAAGEGPANLARAAKHDEQRIHCGHRG
jgi:hypothetical protein